MKKDFATIWIWTCIVLSVAGIGTHFWLSNRIDAAKKDTPQALRALKDIAQARSDIGFLQRELQQDEFHGKESDQHFGFFQDMAKDAGEVPTPQIEKARDTTPAGAKGFQDRTFEMDWGRTSRRQKQSFTRQQIAAFCFNIETRTKLLKVTELDLRAADTKNFEADQWELSMAVTERKPD